MVAFRCDMSSTRSFGCVILVWIVLVFAGGGAFAQSAGPQPLPMPMAIATPKDVPYPGTIRLSVDTTDLERRMYTMRESIPVRAGEPTVLLLPQWLPGNHSPTGRADKLAGLVIRANGARVGSGGRVRVSRRSARGGNDDRR